MPVDSDHLSEQFFAEQDIYRYRKQRGVNLGSWFVLERWICEEPFRVAQHPAQSDLDIAKGQNAKEVLEHHWDSWISEDDWVWMAGKGINAVRIPIGYYHICGTDRTVLRNTDFDHLDSIYAGAWARITNALATAHRYGIGVLFDLHAAPGKQNHDSHSGTSLQPSFFNHRDHMTHTTEILTSFASHILSFARTHNPPLPNLIGIELLNEPQPGAHGDTLKEWYRGAFRAIRAIDPNLPIYIGDCWMPEEYAAFAKSASTPFVVLDHHLYRCFTAGDIATPAAEHARRLRDRNAGTPAAFARARGELEGAGGALIVGEWSAALNPGSLQGVGGDGERVAKRDFVEAQLALFEEHCAGWFFWTYKKEKGRDTGWSFRDAVDAGVIPASLGGRQLDVSRGIQGRDERKAKARDSALDQHAAYWAQYPGHYEHQRFCDGFMIGWDDAILFASRVPAGSCSRSTQELGFIGPWTKRRVSEHVAMKGNQNVWEFEHGFAQGVNAALDDIAAR